MSTPQIPMVNPPTAIKLLDKYSQVHPRPSTLQLHFGGLLATLLQKMNSEYRIEELTKNNDIPSDAAVDEVKAMLQQPLRDLHDLDFEIQSLEQRLTELKTRRTEVQKLITPYQSIVATLRRLPTDILGEIFYHCLPTHRNSIIKTTECPMLLTQICSRWRAVAIADSRLWAGLYITFSDEDMIPVGYVDGISSQSLRTRIDGVKEWLSRSGSRPLSITLKVTTHSVHHNRSSANLNGHMMLELFPFLASISPRFEKLEVDMAFGMYRSLERMLVLQEMEMLKSFRGVYHTSRSVFGAAELDLGFTVVRLMDAPNLQKLSLSGCSVRLLGDQTQDWSRLTHIAWDKSLSVSQLAHFLKQAHSLVFFRFTVDNNDSTQPHSFERAISLPHLRTLHITEMANRLPTSRLYESLDAPSLDRVAYFSHFTPQRSQPPENAAPIPIIPLFNSSPALRRLTFDVQDISLWGIDRLLRAAWMITHLTFRTRRRTSSPSSSTPEHALMAYDPYDRFRTPFWDVGGLLASHLPNAETSSALRLLPNLESLDISLEGVYFSDEMLRDFVLNRLGPLSARGVKPLKHVGVTFYRKKEMDVEGKIRRHAQRVGAEIDLQFSYLDGLSNEQPRTFSPAYGLYRYNLGQSWIPRELDGDDEMLDF